MAAQERTAFDLTKKDWKEFQFYEHQLGVIDTKAENVLWVASVVIVISTLTTLFGSGVPMVTRYLATAATVLVLISVLLCTLTIRVKWADKTIHSGMFDRTALKESRDRKTEILHGSMAVLFVALSLYVVALVLGLWLR